MFYSQCRGHAAFYSAVDFKNNKTIEGTIVCVYMCVCLSQRVSFFHLMSYHTVLKDSRDNIEALKRAREYSDKFSQTLNHDVFAYR